MIITPGGDTLLRGLHEREDFTIGLVDGSYPVGANTAATLERRDTIHNIRTTSGTRVVSNVQVSQPLNAILPVREMVSLTPSICTVDTAGKVTTADGVTNGLCTVSVTSGYSKRSISQTINTIGASTVYESIANFVPGSLRKYLYDQQIAALAGVTPGAASQRAGVNSPTSMSETGGGVNPNNFLMAPTAAAITAGFTPLPTDLLAEILDGDAGGARWRAWITPHHYLSWSGHLDPTALPAPNSTRIHISGEITLFYSATRWDGALAKLLPHIPASNGGYLPNNTPMINAGISCWARLYNIYSGAEKRWVQPVYIGSNRTPNFPAGDIRAPFQKRAGDGSLANGGDSGSPVFCGINGSLVMLGVTSTQYNVGGTTYYATDYVTPIQAAVTALGASGAFTVGIADLSGFTSYA